MDSFEMNKIIGALLGAVFIAFSVSLISDAIFASPAPATPGYAIAALEEASGGGAADAPTEEPIAVRLQSADPAAGEALFKRCATCHTDDAGGANKIGPNLWNIVSRPVASHEGFSYSSAMRDFAEGGSVVWDYEHLDHFIVSPKSLVKGTAMSFAGLKSPEDRANLIAYLRTTADTEVPLPEVPAEGAAEPAAESGANAEGGDAAAPAEGEQAAPTEAAPTDNEAEGSAPSNAPAPEQQPAVEVPEGDAPTANPSAADPSANGQPAENNSAPAEGGAQPTEAQPAEEQPQPAPSGETGTTTTP